ncbi:hypothetical protein [Mucilaginibacter sp.]|uniref:hypothetical protein n=1 Tax=Mucilaginibacter sp. TaxID=1882438 RepID=UPI0026155D66|nr:hypothetical protein [Mucilaginibacter sp.]MDB4926600.1 hypothetical protein [Mucilaginibacter sp.]
MKTADILNRHIAETDGLRVIRLKIHCLIQSDELDDETIKIIVYLDGALSLNIVAANNREKIYSRLHSQ